MRNEWDIYKSRVNIRALAQPSILRPNLNFSSDMITGMRELADTRSLDLEFQHLAIIVGVIKHV